MIETKDQTSGWKGIDDASQCGLRASKAISITGCDVAMQSWRSSFVQQLCVACPQTRANALMVTATTGE